MKVRLNLFSTNLRPDNDEVFLQLRLIISRPGNGQLALAEETVAVGGVPCSNRRIVKRNDLAIQQRHDPSDRPDEARALRAGPDHGLWPGDLANRFRENFLQNVGRE